MLMFARSTVAAVILSVVLAVLTALMLADSLHNFKQYQADLAANQQSINSQEFLRIQPCVNEDGSGGTVPCVWDAHTQGNGLGDSFWIDSNGGFNYYV